MQTKKCIMLSFFAHKGGVGKTTAIHNIACILAREFRLKVLLIDADPQCSLTGSVMREIFTKKGEEQTSEVVPDGIEDKNSVLAQIGEEMFYKEAEDSEERRTIYQCIIKEKIKEKLRALTSDGAIEKRLGEIKLQEVPGYENTLYFLPGDMNLNLVEMDVAKGLVTGQNDALWSCIPGAVSRLIRTIGDSKGFDVLLMDLNPGASALNTALVMGGDYFVIPNLPDYYSGRSINSIGNVLGLWDNQIKYFRNSEDVGGNYFTMPRCPKFLGYLFNKVKLINKKPTQDHQIKIEKITEKVKKIFELTDQQPAVVQTLNLDQFKTKGFQFWNPPLIKEFTRAFSKTSDVGIAYVHSSYQNIPQHKDNIKQDEFDRDVQAAFESCFCAILLIFSNMSDEHHLGLCNIFKQNYRQPFLLEEPGDLDQLQGMIGDIQLTFSIIRPTKRLILQEEVSEALKTFKNDKWRQDKMFLFEEIKLYSDHGEVGKLRESIKKNHSKLENAKIENQHVDYNMLYKIGHMNQNENAGIYFHDLLELKKQETCLNQILLKEEDDNHVNHVLEHYVEQIKNAPLAKPLAIGPKVLKLYATHTKKPLRIWKLKSGSNTKIELVSLEEDQHQEDSMPNIINILLRDELHFDYITERHNPLNTNEDPKPNKKVKT